MPNNESANYNCAQQELYTSAQLGWNSCEDHLTDFAAFSPRYTADYCAACRTEIAAARGLPSDILRSSLSEDNRTLLTRAADNGLLKWQSLKRYIVEAYDAERGDTMLKAAGQSLYTDASRYSWQKVNALLDEGSLFIKNNLADLVANNNMPPNFGDDFDTAKDGFETLQAKFLGGVTNTTANTQNKIKANNNVYAKLIKMLTDGQIIFANDNINKQKFIFDNIRSIVSGINAAGIRGYVTAADTSLPIAGVTVATANNTYTAVTDVEGRFDLKGMAANDYVLTIDAAGYASVTLPVTVKTGTVSSLDVILVLETKSV